MANDNQKYEPAQWEKITAVAVAFFGGGLNPLIVDQVLSEYRPLSK
jgi:hypothetical protein